MKRTLRSIPMPYSIEGLEAEDNPAVLFRGIVGSRAYGTQNANSDTDVRGVFVVPSAEYARLDQPPKQVSDARNDKTFYSLLRFCELAAEANPTTLEMLFLPADCILKTSPAHAMLVANRGLFVTQKAVDSHLGYALSQIKKAKGANKRVWNPWPEEPPRAEDYCLFLDDAKGSPVTLEEAKVDLANCKVTRLVGNRAADLFALYDYGAPTGGIFHGGTLVETDASGLDRAKRAGLLIYNEQAFNSAKRQHREYWEWRRNRNESRWTAQERGQMDYDAKNMMHLVRLLMSGESLVKTGEPIVRFDGEWLETLLSILRGEWKFDDVMAFADEKRAVIEAGKGGLPPDCDTAQVDDLVASVMKESGVS